MSAGCKERVSILLVDDDLNLLQLYEAILADTFDVRTATRGETAIDIVNESIDAVLLDRRMPGMSGDDLLVALREHGDDTPIGMISAVTPDIDIIDLPFDMYLTKPIDRDELRATIELLVQFDGIDKKSREFLRLAAKKVALNHTDQALKDSKKYRELLERMETLQADVNDQSEMLLENHPSEAVRSLRENERDA